MKTIHLNNSVILGTSEAFFGRVFHDDKILMVPYVNVDLGNYEYDGRRDPFIDKCLFVSRTTMQFRCDDEITTIAGSTADGFIFLGGEPIEASPPWYEAEFHSSDAQLILLSESRVSASPFEFEEEQLPKLFDRRNWEEPLSDTGELEDVVRVLNEYWRGVGADDS